MQALTMQPLCVPATKKRSRVLVWAALAWLVGCGGGGPALELPADPKAASQASLEALFSQITAQETDGQARQQPGRPAREPAQDRGRRAGAAGRRDRAGPGSPDFPRVDGRLPPRRRPEGARRRQGDRPLRRGRPRRPGGRARAGARGHERARSSSARARARGPRQATSCSSASSSSRASAALAGRARPNRLVMRRSARSCSATCRRRRRRRSATRTTRRHRICSASSRRSNPERRGGAQKKCDVDGKVMLKQFSQALETRQRDCARRAC